MATAPTRRRARTIEAPRQELDMLVLEYSCQDESAFTAIGKNCKEVKWRVGAMETEPFEIRLHVEKMPGRTPRVTITANGKKLFPQGSEDKDKLKADFQQKWPFRGAPKGIDQRNFFEVQPAGAPADEWLPAISVRPRRDGSAKFEALVWFPGGEDGKGKEVNLPAVEREQIREAESKRPLQVPERQLVLDVCKEDPLKNSTLSLIDEQGSEDITHFFARPTPPAGKSGAAGGKVLATMPAPNEVRIELDKERSKARVSAGHDELVRYLSSKVRAISSEPESKTKMTWKFEVGPYATHVVTLEKVYKSSKIVTLSVDGKVLIEAASKDLDLDDHSMEEDASTEASGPWTGAFRLIGERSVKARVFEEDQEGQPLDSSDVLELLPKEKVKYVRNCRVTVTDQRDLRAATLAIDGEDFASLRHASKMKEPEVECEPAVLKMQYALEIPRKVREVPPTKLQAMQKRLKEAGQQWHENWEKAQPGLQDLQGKIGAFFA